MRVTSFRVMLMVEVVWFILMESTMREYGIGTKLMDMVYTSIKMGLRMRVNGRRTYSQGRV